MYVTNLDVLVFLRCGQANYDHGNHDYRLLKTASCVLYLFDASLQTCTFKVNSITNSVTNHSAMLQLMREDHIKNIYSYLRPLLIHKSYWIEENSNERNRLLLWRANGRGNEFNFGILEKIPLSLVGSWQQETGYVMNRWCWKRFVARL